jgi:tripartite-type tricarboxylate transporter receptor subunit TctC
VKKIKTLAMPLLLGALALVHTTSQAQAWPTKPIKLIAPSTAGGPPDVYARALAEQLGKLLGQPLVVENSPAAGGMIGAQQIMRAPADGYTLLVNTAGMMTITPNANPKAQYKASDFTQICQGVEAGLVLASNPSLGSKTYGELATWIKSQKTPPIYSSYSLGSPAHFLGYQLGEALKTEMTHIPYKSSPQQINDMLADMAPLGFVQIATASPHIKAGKLVAYATTGDKRAAQLPNVPTVGELGLPQLTTTVWFGLSGPKNLPPAIVTKLTQAHQKVLASPEFQTRMATAGLDASPDICGDKFMRKMNVETERWARIIKATGFEATN